MQVTIVPPDSIVGVDGVFYRVDMTGIRAGIHAVQFDGVAGEIEFVDKTNMNEPITSLTEFQAIVDRWQAAHDAATAPPAPPTLAEARADKAARFANLRNADAAKPVLVSSKQYPADADYRSDIAAMLSQRSRGKPLTRFPSHLLGLDGTPAPLTDALLEAIEDAITAQRTAAWTKYGQKLAALNAATTPAEVDAITW